MILKSSEIKEEISVCPYCMNDFPIDSWRGCCGEVHSERAYVTVDGECYLESEVTIEEEHGSIPR